MGIETIVIVSAAVISLAGTAASLIMGYASKKKMKRNDLGALQVTQAQENSPIPICYGTVRIAGNIIWYGNQTMKKKSVGGKGAKGTDQVSIRVDVHQMIAYGTYAVNGLYVDEEPYTPNASLEYNQTIDGTPLTGTTHVMFRGWDLGANNTTVPSVQFSITRDMSHVPAWATAVTSDGDNPASIVYDLLRIAGISDGDFDQASFSASATLWAAYGWGLNIVLSEQKDVTEHIKDLFEQIPATLFIDENNKYVLISHQLVESPSYTIEETDLKDMVWERTSLSNCSTDFVATFIDTNRVERTAHIKNEAVARLIGTKTKNIDLSYFNQNNVNSRLSWYLKEESYPLMKMTAKIPLYYSASCTLGSIFELTYTPWDSAPRSFRITNIKKMFEELALEITAMEHLAMPYSYAQTGQGHVENDMVKTPETLDYKHAVVIPAYYKYPNNSLLLLAARKVNVERTFKIYWSIDDDTYYYGGNFNNYSTHGTLETIYPDDTYDVDDTVGFDIDLADDEYLNNVSRSELFSNNRFIVVGDELMKFQSATLITGTTYHIAGIVRQAKVSHTIGENVWIGTTEDNILTNIPSEASPLYIKFLPVTFWDELDDDTAIQITYVFNPSPVYATVTRDNDDLHIEVIPNSQTVGIGFGEKDQIDMGQPYPIVGQIRMYESDPDVYTVLTSTQFTISHPTAYTLNFIHIINNRQSSVFTIIE